MTESIHSASMDRLLNAWSRNRNVARERWKRKIITRDIQRCISRSSNLVHMAHCHSPEQQQWPVGLSECELICSLFSYDIYCSIFMCNTDAAGLFHRIPNTLKIITVITTLCRSKFTGKMKQIRYRMKTFEFLVYLFKLLK